METRLIKIVYKDGSTFNIYCANRSQINRVYLVANQQADKIESVEDVISGIHSVKDFEKIAKFQ